MMLSVYHFSIQIALNRISIHNSPMTTETSATTATKSPTSTPLNPNSLWRSLFWFVLASGFVFASAWFWLTFQLKVILSDKIDETGQHLASIAAIAAAEPLLAGDEEYLTQLAQNILAKPFIEKVTIFRANGTQVVNLQADLAVVDSENLPQTTWRQWLTAHLPKYQSDAIVFMPEIYWDEQAIGWLQITLDRRYLEQNIRDMGFTATAAVLLAYAMVLFFGLLVILRRHWQLRKAPVENLVSATEAHDDNEDLTSLVGKIKRHEKLAKDTKFKKVTIRQVTRHQCHSRDYQGRSAFISLSINVANNNTEQEDCELLNAFNNLISEIEQLHSVSAKHLGFQRLVLLTFKNNDEHLEQAAYTLWQVLSHSECFENLECKIVVSTLEASYFEYEGNLINWRSNQQLDYVERIRTSAPLTYITMNAETESELNAEDALQMITGEEWLNKVSPNQRQLLERQIAELIRKCNRDD